MKHRQVTGIWSGKDKLPVRTTIYHVIIIIIIIIFFDNIIYIVIKIILFFWIDWNRFLRQVRYHSLFVYPILRQQSKENKSANEDSLWSCCLITRCLSDRKPTASSHSNTTQTRTFRRALRRSSMRLPERSTKNSAKRSWSSTLVLLVLTAVAVCLVATYIHPTRYALHVRPFIRSPFQVFFEFSVPVIGGCRQKQRMFFNDDEM